MPSSLIGNLDPSQSNFMYYCLQIFNVQNFQSTADGKSSKFADFNQLYQKQMFTNGNKEDVSSHTFMSLEVRINLTQRETICQHSGSGGTSDT